MVSSIKQLTAVLIALCVAIGASGCASRGQVPEQKDPYEKFNRAVYNFNDKVDRVVLKPVATGYRKIIPAPARRSVGNFFRNLLEPTTVINHLLQGKFEQAGVAGVRFLFNSTFGLLGLFDVATALGLERQREDFGQTLAVWGVKPGPYIMLPFLGPSNLRDAFGLVPYYLATDPRLLIKDDDVKLGLLAVDTVDTRAQFLSSGAILDFNFDPYLNLRDIYHQKRVDLIYDGDPPLDEDLQ